MTRRQMETVLQAAFIMENKGRNDIADKLRKEVDTVIEQNRHNLWKTIIDEADKILYGNA